MVCLFGLDRLLSPGERSVDRVAIHRSPIYARCHRDIGPLRSLPGLALFLFFSFFLKTNALRSILAVIQTSIFLQREIDCSSWMSPLQSSGQDDWPRAIARDWRLRKGWKSLQSGLFPVPTPDEHIIKQASWKKKTVVQSHARPRKCLIKVQKAMLFAWSKGRDAPEPRALAVIIQSVY